MSNNYHPVKVYFGHDSRFPLVSHVAANSLIKHSVKDFDYKFLDLAEMRREFKLNLKTDNKASTEFTYTRFLIPYLQAYSGLGIFVDNDVLFTSDLSNLLLTLISKYKHADCFPAIICRKHNYQPEAGIKMYGAVQEPYPRKNWSSFMIMNCTKLLCWTKAVVEQADGARLHQFKDIPDEEIVDIEEIEPGWNDLTHLRPETKLLHYTEGGPWFDKYIDCPHADLWFKAFKEYFGYAHTNDSWKAE